MNCNSKQSECDSDSTIDFDRTDSADFNTLVTTNPSSTISPNEPTNDFAKLTPDQRHWEIDSENPTYQGFKIIKQ